MTNEEVTIRKYGEEDKWSRTDDLLKQSGICRRGVDSHLYGYGEISDDRMGVLRDDGSLWLWSPDYHSGSQVARFIDLVNYCEEKDIEYSFNTQKLKAELRGLSKGTKAIDSLLEKFNEAKGDLNIG